MPRESLPEACLKAIQDVMTEAIQMHLKHPAGTLPELQRITRSLGQLEEIARRRVDTATFAEHERQMHVCHIVNPVKLPVQRV